MYFRRGYPFLNLRHDALQHPAITRDRRHDGEIQHIRVHELEVTVLQPREAPAQEKPQDVTLKQRHKPARSAGQDRGGVARDRAAFVPRKARPRDELREDDLGGSESGVIRDLVLDFEPPVASWFPAHPVITRSVSL
ncbi:MAG: hypothetical protein A2Y95_12180 [Deltaproteobacteria bacterium RBG_13_65_10]|nr:MAG: hypothetical protein A2Y95_12180 [Deltaproteobacteria bacterium RBG_13_65_10]